MCGHLPGICLSNWTVRSPRAGDRSLWVAVVPAAALTALAQCTPSVMQGLGVGGPGHEELLVFALGLRKCKEWCEGRTVPRVAFPESEGRGGGGDEQETLPVTFRRSSQRPAPPSPRGHAVLPSSLWPAFPHPQPDQVSFRSFPALSHSLRKEQQTKALLWTPRVTPRSLGGPARVLGKHLCVPEHSDQSIPAWWAVPRTDLRAHPLHSQSPPLQCGLDLLLEL